MAALGGAAVLGYATFVAIELRAAAVHLSRTLEPLASATARAPASAPSPTRTEAALRAAPVAPSSSVTIGGASELDSAPPRAVPVASLVASAPPNEITLADEHMPAVPAKPSNADADLTDRQLEALLANDPEALRKVRAMLSEPDLLKRAENLTLIRETFGIE
jgi:hypothetical protein